MSNSSAVEAILRANAEAYENAFINRSCVLIALTYYVYDYLLTFPGEVSLVWRRRKFSGTILLFLLNRYSTLFSMILNPLNSLPWPNQTPQVRSPHVHGCCLHEISCVSPYILSTIFTLLSYVSIASFSAVRAYAIGGPKKIISIIVLISGLILPGTMMTIYIDSSVGVFGPPVYGCAEDLNMSAPVYLKCTLLTAGRIGTIIADALVVYLTWKTTNTSLKFDGEVRAESSLMPLVLRDGTLYFSVMFLLNLAEVLEVNLDVSFQPLEPFLDSLGPILVTHFVLHLRQESDGALDSTGLSAIHFVTCTLKDMGASLFHGDSTDYDCDSSDVPELHRASEISDISFMEGVAQDGVVGLSGRQEKSRSTDNIQPFAFDARQRLTDGANAV